MQANWNVTYDVVTPESAEYGDFAEGGYLANDVSFREALEVFADGFPAHMASAVSADGWPLSGAVRWFDSAPDQNFQTGAWTTRVLHIPVQITPASRLRLARFLGLPV